MKYTHKSTLLVRDGHCLSVQRLLGSRGHGVRNSLEQFHVCFTVSNTDGEHSRTLGVEMVKILLENDGSIRASPENPITIIINSRKQASMEVNYYYIIITAGSAAERLPHGPSTNKQSLAPAKSGIER